MTITPTPTGQGSPLLNWSPSVLLVFLSLLSAFGGANVTVSHIHRECFLLTLRMIMLTQLMPDWIPLILCLELSSFLSFPHQDL